MSRLFYIIILIFSITAFANGQDDKFDKLTNDFLFRMPNFQADSTTQAFLKKYVPFLVKKPTPGGWIAYPPKRELPPELLTIHAFEFKKHPFVNLKFRNGIFEFLTTEINNEVVMWRTCNVWFIFNNRKDADIAFKQIQLLFNKVSSSKKIYQKGYKKIAEYKTKTEKRWIPDVQIVLTKDEIDGRIYKILFRRIILPIN